MTDTFVNCAAVDKKTKQKNPQKPQNINEHMCRAIKRSLAAAAKTYCHFITKHSSVSLCKRWF